MPVTVGGTSTKCHSHHNHHPRLGHGLRPFEPGLHEGSSPSGCLALRASRLTFYFLLFTLYLAALPRAIRVRAQKFAPLQTDTQPARGRPCGRKSLRPYRLRPSGTLAVFFEFSPKIFDSQFGRVKIFYYLCATQYCI
jgi:hypothetical protein